MSNPHIVCIMCNHNYQDYIEEAMRSVLNQDYAHLTLCVIDDSSSDDSPKIIERIADEDFRVTALYLRQGVGAAEARNSGIRYCWDKADYFLMVDSDDVCKPNKVSEMLKVMEMSNGIIGCYGDYDVINMSTKNVIREFKEPYSLKGLQQNCIIHSSAMIRKDGLDVVKEMVEGKVSYYDKELHGWRGDGSFIGSCEDYELFLRLSEKGIFAHIPKTLTTVRVHDKNQSQIEKVNKVWHKNIERIQQKIQARHANNVNKA